MDFELGALVPFFLTALVLALVAIRVLQRWAPRLGLMDRPGGRKAHQRPTPVVGGVGIGIAFALSVPWLIAAQPALVDWWPLAAGMAVLLLAGLVDDARGLASGPKFLVQGLVAVAAMVWGGVELAALGTWPSGATAGLGPLILPFTLLALVGFVNAFNMIDGVDGLAGSTAVVMLGLLAVAAVLAAAPEVALLAGTLLAAVLGFLVFNLRSPLRRRASVFLGDAGSLMLGLAIVWLAIDVSQRPGAAVSPLGIAWILVLPVVDTLSLMIRRILRGQNPFHPDRNHLHHILGRAGFSVGQCAMVYAGLTLALGLAGLSASLIGVPDVLLAGLLVMVTMGHYFFVRYAWRSIRGLKRLRVWLAEADEHRSPHTDRMALGGLYGLAVAVPLGWSPLLLAAGGLLVVATLAHARAVVGALRGLTITPLALGLGVWITLAVWLRPAPDAAAWLPMVWLSGVLALPVGWWLARFRHHALPLFTLAAVVLLGGWVATVDWGMIEAGYFRTPAYWGDVRTGGLLLTLMLMVLLGGGVSIAVAYRRQWRARAGLLLSMGGTVTVLVLLIGLQLQSAVLAGVVGLVAMVIAALVHRHGARLAGGLAAAVVMTALLGGLFANTFKPPGVSLDEQYLSPVQAALLHLGGAPSMAESRFPAVAARMEDWSLAAQGIAARPFGGYGRPAVTEAAGAQAGASGANPAPVGWGVSPDLPGTRSAYAALALTGGLPALALLAALLWAWMRGIRRAVSSQAWPLAQGVVAHGALWSVLALMALAPVVISPINGLIVTGVLALGVMAALDARDAADGQSRGPMAPNASTESLPERPALQLVDQSRRARS